MMNDTWSHNLMDILTQARLGNSTELNDFVANNFSFAVTNNDYTILLVLRHFEVQFWQDERRVLNCKPEDENFQWGITITTSSESGETQSNIYLPNNENYIGLKIQNSEVEILIENTITKTNVTELFRKLEFWGEFTEQDIKTAFNSLCNDDYTTKQKSKPTVKSKIIENKILGKLIYNKKLEYYEADCQKYGAAFQISIALTQTKKLEKIIAFAEQQIQNEFYKGILLAMETEMIKLKNEVWLEEDEDGNDEPTITTEQFRQRISINCIRFYDDFSSEIYCNDDDLFFGHTIIIDVDKNGKFKMANLAG